MASRDVREMLRGFESDAAAIVAEGVAKPYAVIDSNSDRWHSMVSDLRTVLAADPDFQPHGNTFIHGKQIMLSEWQAPNLLKISASRGVDSALKWFAKIRNITSANIDVICEITGLIIDDRVIFSNGVELLPLSLLPDRPQTRHLIQSVTVGRGDMYGTMAAAVITKHNIAATLDHVLSHQGYRDDVDIIRRTINSFTLIDDYAPTIGISWSEFHDDDYSAASVGYGWTGAVFDGRLADHPKKFDSNAYDRVEQFLAVPNEIQQKCDVPLTRLNLARRRKTPGDQAIDGCIALEALLGDRQFGDLTYKLKLRASRLLGDNLEKRREIGLSVGKFYSLRSKVVHGQSAGISQQDQKDADRGLKICSEVLEKIVSSAQLPDILILEYGG